jgi:hypothetical protein
MLSLNKHPVDKKVQYGIWEWVCGDRRSTFWFASPNCRRFRKL